MTDQSIIGSVSLDLESDDSIIEVAKPPKTPPPVVILDVDLEEITLNVTGASIITPISSRTSSTFKTPQQSSSATLTHDNVSPYHWNQEMKKFYNDDWGNEESFVLERLQKEMPKHRHLWDVGNYSNNRSKKRKICFNCGEHGHNERDCRPDCCYMCGADGHVAKLCPRRMCLSCGKKTKLFIPACNLCLDKRKNRCPRCGIVGHIMSDCTDHWRRYHHITHLQHVQPPPEPSQKPARLLWCCNCGRQGHVEAYCNYKRSGQHFPTTTLVSSYGRSFVTDKADGAENGDRQANIQNNKDFADSSTAGPESSVNLLTPINRPKPKMSHVIPTKRLRYFEEIAQSSAEPDTIVPEVAPVVESTNDIIIVSEKINKSYVKDNGRRLCREVVEEITRQINVPKKKNKPNKNKKIKQNNIKKSLNSQPTPDVPQVEVNTPSKNNIPKKQKKNRRRHYQDFIPLSGKARRRSKPQKCRQFQSHENRNFAETPLRREPPFYQNNNYPPYPGVNFIQNNLHPAPIMNNGMHSTRHMQPPEPHFPRGPNFENPGHHSDYREFPRNNSYSQGGRYFSQSSDRPVLRNNPIKQWNHFLIGTQPNIRLN